MLGTITIKTDTTDGDGDEDDYVDNNAKHLPAAAISGMSVTVIPFKLMQLFFNVLS